MKKVMDVVKAPFVAAALLVLAGLQAFTPVQWLDNSIFVLGSLNVTVGVAGLLLLAVAIAWDYWT